MSNQSPRGAQRGCRRGVVKRAEMCLHKRKEKRKYFLKRRLHEQYRIFSGEHPDVATIGSLDPPEATRLPSGDQAIEGVLSL